MTEPEAPATEIAESAPATTETAPEPVQLSDADLRLWAKDNGIEGVPTAGMLSAAWREQILAAMAAAAESEADAGANEGASVTEPSPDASAPASSEDEAEEAAPEAPVEEEEAPPAEYRTPYVAPSTWVSGQYLTTGF